MIDITVASSGSRNAAGNPSGVLSANRMASDAPVARALLATLLTALLATKRAGIAARVGAYAARAHATRAHTALHPAARSMMRVALACSVAFASLFSVSAHAAPADTMIKAVKFDDVNEVNKQLAHGMDPNMTDDQGVPLLVIAAREKSDKVAAALIANPKTNIEIVDKAGENAMMMAALNGDIDLVKLFISKDAEVNKKGWTPLHYAASNGHDDIVQLLLDNSAYIDAGSPNGTTPLMMAARGGHISTIKLLLDSGADITIKNQIGLNALDFAKAYKEPDAIAGLSARMEQMQQQKASGTPAPSQNSAK